MTKLPQTFRERIPSAKPSACFCACGAVHMFDNNNNVPLPTKLARGQNTAAHRVLAFLLAMGINPRFGRWTYSPRRDSLGRRSRRCGQHCRHRWASRAQARVRFLVDSSETKRENPPFWAPLNNHTHTPMAHMAMDFMGPLPPIWHLVRIFSNGWVRFVSPKSVCVCVSNMPGANDRLRPVRREVSPS